MSGVIDDMIDRYLIEEDYTSHYDDFIRMRSRRNDYYEACNNKEGLLRYIEENCSYEDYCYATRVVDDFCNETDFDDDAELQWRTIPGFSEYKIYEDGTIISHVGKKERVIKTWSNQYGHLYVQIRDDYGKPHKVLVHRLVAMTFMPNKKHYPVVMHRDDNPKNNSIYNLRWGTQWDNMQDCKAKGRYFSRKVYCYDTGKIYNSCADAAVDLNVSKSLITVCCEGKVHSVKGFILCYLDEKDEMSEDDLAVRRAASRNTMPILAINIKTGKKKIFESRKAAAESLGLSGCSISSCVNGHLRQTGGWRFENIRLEDYYGRNH